MRQRRQRLPYWELRRRFERWGNSGLLLQQDSTDNPELQAEQAIAWKHVQAEAAEASGGGCLLTCGCNTTNRFSRPTPLSLAPFVRTRAKDYTNKQKSIASNKLASQLTKYGDEIRKI